MGPFWKMEEGGGKAWQCWTSPEPSSIDWLGVKSLLSEVLNWPGEQHPGPDWGYMAQECDDFQQQSPKLVCSLRQGELNLGQERPSWP